MEKSHSVAQADVACTLAACDPNALEVIVQLALGEWSSTNKGGVQLVKHAPQAYVRIGVGLQPFVRQAVGAF